jgi:hypothetical protein
MYTNFWWKDQLPERQKIWGISLILEEPVVRWMEGSGPWLCWMESSGISSVESLVYSTIKISITIYSRFHLHWSTIQIHETVICSGNLVVRGMYWQQDPNFCQDMGEYPRWFKHLEMGYSDPEFYSHVAKPAAKQIYVERTPGIVNCFAVWCQTDTNNKWCQPLSILHYCPGGLFEISIAAATILQFLACLWLF